VVVFFGVKSMKNAVLGTLTLSASFLASAALGFAEDVKIEYLSGTQPYELIGENVTVFLFTMGSGEAPGHNAINDKSIATNACNSKRTFVDRLIQYRTVEGGDYGTREYIVTCSK
jgi:hypothetical protein